jgi:hypothetical protein
MPDLSGSFTGLVRSQSAIVVSDQPGHAIMLAEVVGSQESTDPLWNGSSLFYAAVTDVVNGAGTQRGYYVNTHTDGSVDSGTFEGRVTTVNGVLTVEGSYQNTDGTGKFKGSTGNGTFTTRLTSANEVECTHQGSYQLASAAAAAAG